MEGKNKSNTKNKEDKEHKIKKPHKTLAENKKAKTERLRRENPDKIICGGCNKIKEECDCGVDTKYDPKYCTDIVDYFLKCQAEILVDVKFFQPNKNSTISTILNPLNEEETVDAGNVKEISQKLVMQRFPTMVRYGLLIDVDESTFEDWDKLYPEFLRARNKCKKIQEAILIENGLQGTYNSQFTQFLLKNNHGYKDKTETEHSGEIQQNVVYLPNKK